MIKLKENTMTPRFAGFAKNYFEDCIPRRSVMLGNEKKRQVCFFFLKETEE